VSRKRGEISWKYRFKQNFFKKPRKAGISLKFVCITFAQYCNNSEVIWRGYRGGEGGGNNIRRRFKSAQQGQSANRVSIDLVGKKSRTFTNRK